MAELRVKGHVLEAARREALGRVEAGRLERAELERRLRPEHRSLLDGPILRERWYPMRAWEALAAAPAEEASEPGALRRLAESGRRLADELLEAAGVRTRARGPRAGIPSADWWEPVGFALVTLPASLLSDTSWLLHPAEARGRFTVSVTGAEALPEAWRHLGSGLLERLAARLVGAPVRVTSARPEPGRLLFHARPERSAD